jgi:flagellar motor switch/type III secretory pathway protein FliN
LLKLNNPANNSAINALGLPMVRCEWAAQLHPSKGCVSLVWDEPDESIEIVTSPTATKQDALATFLVFSQPVWLVRAEVEAVDARELFNQSSLGATSAFVANVMAKLLRVPRLNVVCSNESSQHTSQPNELRVRNAGQAYLGIKWRCISQQLSLEFLLDLSSSVGSKLMERPRQTVRSGGIDSPLIASVSALFMRIGVQHRELQTIEEGDMLLGDLPAGTPVTTLIFSNAFVGMLPAMLTFGESTMEISSKSFMQNLDSSDELNTDSAQNMPADRLDEPLAADTQRIETILNVECAISGLMLSMQSLNNLETGHVVTLPISPQHAVVDLRVGGRIIGRGKLIEVDNLLAVQVLESYKQQ